MTYRVQVDLTVEGDSQQQALDSAAFCVSSKEAFDAGKLQGVGLAQGYVDIDVVAEWGPPSTK